MEYVNACICGGKCEKRAKLIEQTEKFLKVK